MAKRAVDRPAQSMTAVDNLRWSARPGGHIGPSLMDQIAALLARAADLRELARASTDPAVREELLAIAAELEALAQGTSGGS